MDVREGEAVEFKREMNSGAASVPASDSAIIRMIRECDGDAFEARLSMNQDLTFRYAQAEFERKGLPLGPGEMRTLGILNPAGVFTNLGLLLSDQCPPTMKAAAFSDDSRSVFTERARSSSSSPTPMRSSRPITAIERSSRALSGLIGMITPQLRFGRLL